MDLVLFGIQGSGKGTQARKLAESKGYIIFETGAELRAIAATNTDLGRTVKSYIDSGHHAPLEVVMSVMHESVGHHTPTEKILFDGIPRNMDQKKEFDRVLAERGREFLCVQLTLPEHVAFERIRGRALEQGRADDADEEAVRRRIALFKEKTVPVIDAYRADGKLIDVDGNGSLDEVYENIGKAIESFTQESV